MKVIPTQPTTQTTKQQKPQTQKPKPTFEEYLQLALRKEHYNGIKH